MKPMLVALAAAAALAAAGSAAVRVTELLRLPPATRAGESTVFGHVRSLTHRNGRYELRFDPAWWLTGVTAQRAKLEDTGSSDVPNDYYIVEEGHRLLTYVVPATARVTVLTGGTNTTTVSVARFAQIVRTRENNPGFWLRIAGRYPNGVLSIDQQYQP